MMADKEVDAMLTVAHCTEIGSGGENEDAFIVRPHPSDENCLLCAVADGQGGQPFGGTASRLACQVCIDLASRTALDRLASPMAWTEIIRQTDQTVAGDRSAGKTTLIGLSVHGNHVHGASHGDSAAVMLGLGQPMLVLTERQRKDPPVGSGSVIATGFSVEVAAPWKLLVMTDGVWKYAGWEWVRHAAGMTDMNEILDTLRAAARPRFGRFQDDFTLVVVHRPYGLAQN
jgi:serine/threonine protein phosphatase PrpC